MPQASWAAAFAGRRAEELKGAGHHEVSWRPHDVAPGVYFLRLRAGATSVVRKITLVE